MPVINFKYDDLCSLLGKDVPQQTLIDRIPLIGADMHDTEGEANDMSVEFFPDRPDLYSVEGLARSMRAFLDIKSGPAEYEVIDTDVDVFVDSSVTDIRPEFLCATVYDVKITDELLRSLMELQEKLHITIGRKRSKLAIGIHDLDKISSPFTYTTVEPKEVSFVPLAKTEVMDLDEILSEHEKGVDYAHLLKGMSRYPIIFDSKNNVISFPPIINGSLTTVTTDTRNIFVDVTGNDVRAVKGALDIVVTALAERGGKIGRVHMKGVRECISPDLSPRKMSISSKECDKFVGVELGATGIVEALKRMGMDAYPTKDGTDNVDVLIPSTRVDIMHKVDIFEDVAIGYGFDRFGGEYELEQTNGHLSPVTAFSETVRDLMIGLGFNEVTTLTLSSEREEFILSGLPEVDNVRLTNPITEDHTCLRSNLMPSLMRILRHNKHRDLPQRIFEIGFVIRDGKTVPHLCALATASKTSFTEIKSITESVLREMSVEYSVSPCGHPTFVDGRGAFISMDGEEIGIFGEISPRVVTDYDITHPIIMLELDLSNIITKKANSLF